jgi:hypothetical protein
MWGVRRRSNALGLRHGGYRFGRTKRVLTLVRTCFAIAFIYVIGFYKFAYLGDDWKWVLSVDICGCIG